MKALLLLQSNSFKPQWVIFIPTDNHQQLYSYEVNQFKGLI